MAAIILNRTVWAGTTLIAGYWALAWLLPFFILYEFIVSLLIGSAVAVILLYAPATVRGLLAGRLDRVGQLSLGIIVGMFAIIGSRLWHLAWRAAGEPDAMSHSDWLTFWFFLMLLSTFLHATAPSAGLTTMPKRSLLTLVAALVSGALLAGIILGAKWDDMVGLF